MKKVMLCGEFWAGSLEESYAHAFRTLGFEVSKWAGNAETAKRVTGGRLGLWMIRRFEVSPWLSRANRDFVLAVARDRPDLIVLFGRTLVPAGAIAQIKATWPSIRVVLIWPDSLLQLNRLVLDQLPILDGVASFCGAYAESFRRLGARGVLWLPFAADDRAFTAADVTKPTHDVVFIGNHKPEREMSMLCLIDAGLRVCVWGPSDWRKFARNPNRVREYWMGHKVSGDQFVAAARRGKVMINPIDPTTAPGTNMRFFESLATRVSLVCSEGFDLQAEATAACVCVTFDGTDDGLVLAVKTALAQRNQEQIQRAFDWVRSRHTYQHRCRTLVAWLQGRA